MKITKLKTHVELEYREHVYHIPYESYYQLKLYDIETIDTKSLKKISYVSDCYQAKEIALKSLKNPKTQYEIKQKLSSFSQEVIQETMHFLIQYHYIDDLKYMQLFTLTKRNYSKKMLSQKFKEKGIQFEQVDTYLKTIDDASRIIDTADKIIQGLKGLTIKQKQKKLQEKLYRLGFSYESIQSYLNTRSLEKEDEKQLLERLFIKKAHQLKGNPFEKCQSWIRYALSKGFEYEDAKRKCEDMK
jgi:SOS response regulatory protein OraA/RecX